MYEADDAFLRGRLDHAAAEITVARLHDNFQVSHLVAKFELCQNLSKDAKKMFVPEPLAKGLLALLGWTNTMLSAWHAKFSNFFVFLTVVIVLTKSNIGPYRSLFQTCLLYAVGVENNTFKAQTTHLRLHRPVYPYGFAVIPMDSDLKFHCYAGWVKNYGHCLIFPFPHFKLE